MKNKLWLLCGGFMIASSLHAKEPVRPQNSESLAAPVLFVHSLTTVPSPSALAALHEVAENARFHLGDIQAHGYNTEVYAYWPFVFELLKANLQRPSEHRVTTFTSETLGGLLDAFGFPADLQEHVMLIATTDAKRMQGQAFFMKRQVPIHFDAWHSLHLSFNRTDRLPLVKELSEFKRAFESAYEHRLALSVFADNGLSISSGFNYDPRAIQEKHFSDGSSVIYQPGRQQYLDSTQQGSIPKNLLNLPHNAQLFHVLLQRGLALAAVNQNPGLPSASMLMPHFLDLLPQRLTVQAAAVPLEILRLEKNSGLKFLFNSFRLKGGFASIDHLHFHMLFAEGLWPMETARRIFWKIIDGIEFLVLDDYAASPIILRGPDLMTLARRTAELAAFYDMLDLPYVVMWNAEAVFFLPRTEHALNAELFGKLHLYEAAGRALATKMAVFEGLTQERLKEINKACAFSSYQLRDMLDRFDTFRRSA